MKNWKKEDFRSCNVVLESLIETYQILSSIQEGVGLRQSQSVTLNGLNEVLKAEQKRQWESFPTITSIVDKWFEFKDDKLINDAVVVEKFDSFICDLMKRLKIK